MINRELARTGSSLSAMTRRQPCKNHLPNLERKKNIFLDILIHVTGYTLCECRNSFLKHLMSGLQTSLVLHRLLKLPHSQYFPAYKWQCLLGRAPAPARTAPEFWLADEKCYWAAQLSQLAGSMEVPESRKRYVLQFLPDLNQQDLDHSRTRLLPLNFKIKLCIGHRCLLAAFRHLFAGFSIYFICTHIVEDYCTAYKATHL